MQKEKRNGSPNIGNENIQSRYMDEFCHKECTMLINRNEKRKMTGIIKLSSQEKVRTLEEKENYKYSEILDADIKKQKTSGDDRKDK